MDIESLVKNGNSDTVFEYGDSFKNSDSSVNSISNKTNKTVNCITSVEIHKENCCIVTSKAVSKDSIVETVNNRERLAVNGVTKKRPSQQVSYKERAKNKVNKLIHRHTL